MNPIMPGCARWVGRSRRPRGRVARRPVGARRYAATTGHPRCRHSSRTP